MYNTSNIENSQPTSSSRPINGRANQLVRCLITTLILLLLAFTAFSLILWLILRPRLPEFQVESLSISNTSISMEFTVENPNWKINLWFSGFGVVLSHENCEVSRGSVPGFPLRRSSGTRMKVNGINGGIKVEKLKNLGLDLSKKEVNFDVKMNGVAWFRHGKWINKEISVQVLCKKLEVGFTNNGEGKLSNSTGETDCSVFSNHF